MIKYNYCNYRCRCCGKLISVHTEFDPYAHAHEGGLFGKNRHTCCRPIEEGESILADFISVSVEPLKDAEVVEK